MSEKELHDTSIKSNMDEYGLGSLYSEIERNQDNVIDAVKKYGGTGKVTVKFTYKMSTEGVVTVFSDVKPEFPKRQLTPVPMHVTKKGKLSPHPENQYTTDQVTEEIEKSKTVEDIGKQQANILDISKKTVNGNG